MSLDCSVDKTLFTQEIKRFTKREMESFTAVNSTRRLLIYSHDSFGLGHLRRCRIVAHALVEQDPDLSIVILSGSPLIDRFDFHPQVKVIGLPGIIKQRNGDYRPLDVHQEIEELVSIRSSLIFHTAEQFQPLVFLVDKEPLGLRGEVKPTLEWLHQQKVPCILGLRDVIDDPHCLAQEWERKNVIPALEYLYDEIWIYGLAEIYHPLIGLELPAAVQKKLVFTGYLRRPIEHRTFNTPEHPFFLVTTGGGGDGEDLVDWVLRAYEADRSMPYHLVIVFGPFMDPVFQRRFATRAASLGIIDTIGFDNHPEELMSTAKGIVAMGGYNTFCEILSFNRPSLIVPRHVPRREQLIRAQYASALGLCTMLIDDDQRDVTRMITGLRRLAEQPSPSSVFIPDILDGLERLKERFARWINKRPYSSRSIM